MLPWSQIVQYFVALSQIMLQHMLVISHDSTEQSLIGTVEHFRHLWNVAVFVAQPVVVEVLSRRRSRRRRCCYYEGRPINKLQNDIILLIFKI